MVRKLSTLFLFFYSVSSVFFSVNANESNTPFTFYTESYPPANYYDNGELKGITIDTLKLIWKTMGIKEHDIMVVPWARGYRNTLNNKNSALFTMSRTQAREPLFKWVGPVFNSVHVLMAKKEKKIKVDSLGHLFEYRVATIRGDISEISLQQIGFPDFNLAKVTDLERALYMMLSDRVDMMMVSIHGFKHLTKQLNVDSNLFEPVWRVNKVGNYIAFNKDTPTSTIESYQSVFDALQKERDKIKEKYTLPEEEY